jgi:hypothetical protein
VVANLAIALRNPISYTSSAEKALSVSVFEGDNEFKAQEFKECGQGVIGINLNRC